jgi:hypothetical protein
LLPLLDELRCDFRRKLEWVVMKPCSFSDLSTTPEVDTDWLHPMERVDTIRSIDRYAWWDTEEVLPLWWPVPLKVTVLAKKGINTRSNQSFFFLLLSFLFSYQTTLLD